MKVVKPILLLTLLFIVFLALAGCSGGGGGNSTPSASPTASGGYTTREIDYTDDFSDSSSGWGIEGGPDSGDAIYYYNNRYVMQLYGTERRWSSGFKSKLIGDYIMEVAVKNGKDTEALGGIYFNDGAGNHNVFVIMPKTQEYTIATEDPNNIGGMDWRFLKQVNDNLPKTFSNIKTDEYNVLKVEVKGSQARFSINGYLLDETITVPLHQDGEKVGLYLSNNIDDDVKMEYDDFHVKGTEIIQN